MLCSRQLSAIERSPRNEASTSSTFCLAVNFPYLRTSLNLTSWSLERPILRSAPDTILASTLRASALLDSGQPAPRKLSTPYRGAGQGAPAAGVAECAGVSRRGGRG